MATLGKTSPIPIALDEELIGITSKQEKVDLIQEIKPQYIILKPSLVGGWQGADQWVSIAEKHAVDWWATSALESNIGLNAIAQWVSTKQINRHKGWERVDYLQTISIHLCILEVKIWDLIPINFQILH